MGYDMYLVDEPSADDKAEHEVAEAAFNKYVQERNALPDGSPDRIAAQERVEEAYQELYRTETWYYRLNIWGMSTMRQIMWDLGMAKDSDAGEEWPEVGMDTDTYYALSELAEDEVDVQSDAFRTEHPEFTPQDVATFTEARLRFERHLRRHDADTPGISLHKLGSNDGWLVTPGECAAAVEIWRRADDRKKYDAILRTCDEQNSYETTLAWVERWVDWLDRASRAGGFKVH